MNPTTQILQVFDGYRMEPTPLDQYLQVGRDLLAEKIQRFVDHGERLKFIMLGFPFKSTNTRDKVLGELPDLGEELTLQNFARFNRDIQQVYSPGVEIGIASDGYIFNDLLGVADQVVDRYKEIYADMGKIAPMAWYSLKDFFSGTTAAKRESLTTLLAPTPEKLEQDILLNPDVNFLYRGMTIFMMEELAIHTWPSKNQHQKAAKKLTREMMMRNEAWSNLVKTEFSDHIRLSMHPSVNNGQKYSFKLIPGPKANHSAWHCVIYLNGQEYVTMHRKDAEAAGLELVYRDGRPYNYQS